MSNVTQEIQALEEELRLAELGPHPDFFERHLSEDALIDGQPLKSKIVEAHRPGSGPKFTQVEVSDLRIIQQGDVAAVVTCTGNFVGQKWSGRMKFMRVWLKKNGTWQIIAGSTLG